MLGCQKIITLEVQVAEQIIMGISFGKTEVFILKSPLLDKKIAISMLYGYKKVNVKSVTFLYLDVLENEWKQ